MTKQTSRLLTHYTATRVAAASAAPSGWWNETSKDALIVYQPLGADSLADSYTNLANPGTYDASAGVAPPFSASYGWQFAGSQYLRTNFTGLSRNMTVLTRISGFTRNSSDYVFGMLSSAGDQVKWYMILGTTMNICTFANGGSTVLFVGGTSFDAIGWAGGDVYVDGSDVGDISDAGTKWSIEPYIGCRNSEVNGAQGFWSGNMQIWALWDGILTGEEVSAMTTAMSEQTGPAPPPL